MGVPKISKLSHVTLSNSADSDKPRDALRGESRSPNMVTLNIRYVRCAIVTLSLRLAVFQIFDFKKCHDLEIRLSGSLEVTESGIIG